MMIGAHPDDIEGTVGGTVALLTDQGTELFYLIVTNGDKGCSNPICSNWTTEQIADARYHEALNAAKVLGVPSSNVQLLDYEDCQTSLFQEQILENIVQNIRKWQPDVIMSWFPSPNYELQPSAGWGDLGFHPDHQTVGAITLSAKFDAGVSRLFPLLGAGHVTKELYFWEFSVPTHYVDISQTLSRKIQAFAEHVTQYSDLELVTTDFTTLASKVASIVNSNSTKQAEGFKAYF